MRERLTDQEKKILKRSLKQGYVLFGSISSLTIILYIATNYEFIPEVDPNIVLFSGLAIGLLIGWLINKNYMLDLRIGEKEIQIKKVNKKEYRKDHEAGSGTLYYGQKMKEFDRYYLIIDSYKYPVKKDLWESVEKNDKINVHIAPKSKEILKFEKN